MKSVYLVFSLLLLHRVSGGALRKTPAFATPVYSNSYLPAAMQVIFYAVEQLKNLQMEEAEQATSTTILPTTLPHSPDQDQPQPSSTEKPSFSQEASVAETEKPNINEGTPSSDPEKPELSQETPEANYGTPETNHETPEVVHEAQEVNQETTQPEKEKEKPTESSTDELETSTVLENVENQQSSQSSSSSEDSSEEEKKKKEPSIDSVVKEIYGIMKPQNKSEDSSEESESKESVESKESGESKDSKDDDDSDEDEVNDENRFTLLGEKVTQVPRPSLSTYLRRSKVPPKCSLQQLALLYDSLSKDARKQGFAKFSGYSDEVLKTLETSAEGGIGPQLQKLLEKTLERHEVTREETRTRIISTLTDLKEPGSELIRDLRLLVPLRFNP